MQIHFCLEGGMDAVIFKRGKESQADTDSSSLLSGLEVEVSFPFFAGCSFHGRLLGLVCKESSQTGYGEAKNVLISASSAHQCSLTNCAL